MRLKTECDAGTLKPSRPRAKAGDTSGDGQNHQDADGEENEGKGADAEDDRSADEVSKAKAASVDGSERHDRRTSASPLPAGIDVVKMDVDLDDFDTTLASYAGRTGSGLDETEQ